MFKNAITRKPGPNFAKGLTNVKWERWPDYKTVLGQHRAYCRALMDLGLDVMILDMEPDFPDAYFVEDTAVILDDMAVLTRPGALSRRGEVRRMAPVLSRQMETIHVLAPGFLEGGDVMHVENHLYIGISARTNEEGANQLGRTARACGMTWSPIPVLAGLHLKTGVNYLGGDTLLMFEEYENLPEFSRFNKIIVEKDEAPAANTLNINNTLLTPAGFPKTLRALESLGMPVITLDMSEVTKMDGGCSCLSLRY